MREILFRGQRINNGEWMYGLPCRTLNKAGEDVLNIQCWEREKDGVTGIYDAVAPETIGQYTGLTDKNGNKIFEGDIVKAQDDIFGSPFCNGITGKIVYAETAFFIEPKNPMKSQWLFNECAVYEVIGNIHDNPELLKEDDN